MVKKSKSLRLNLLSLAPRTVFVIVIMVLFFSSAVVFAIKVNYETTNKVSVEKPANNTDLIPVVTSNQQNIKIQQSSTESSTPTPTPTPTNHKSATQGKNILYELNLKIKYCIEPRDKASSKFSDEVLHATNEAETLKSQITAGISTLEYINQYNNAAYTRNSYVDMAYKTWLGTIESLNKNTLSCGLGTDINFFYWEMLSPNHEYIPYIKDSSIFQWQY